VLHEAALHQRVGGVEEPADVKAYRLAFKGLLAVALTPERSVALILRTAAGMACGAGHDGVAQESSFSDGNTDCVEVASTSDHTGVRDSKNTAIPALFSPPRSGACSSIS
jgi:hypothetical protein